jgi:hypothetical protein
MLDLDHSRHVAESTSPPVPPDSAATVQSINNAK